MEAVSSCDVVSFLPTQCRQIGLKDRRLIYAPSSTALKVGEWTGTEMQWMQKCTDVKKPQQAEPDEATRDREKSGEIILLCI